MHQNFLELVAKSRQQGEYNVNNLPPHPPMGPRFEFLSAPYVEVDSSQLSSAIKTGTPWKAWTYQLFGEAVLTFDVQTATISAFDSKFERFRATTGSTWEQIDRKISIAAHALFSAETMCILDAEEVSLSQFLALRHHTYCHRTGDL